MDATTTIERVQNIAIDRKESRVILADGAQNTCYKRQAPRPSVVVFLRPCFSECYAFMVHGRV
jgi:hypothetical protein